jgi:integrase
MTHDPKPNMPLTEVLEAHISKNDRMSISTAKIRRIHFRHFERFLGRPGLLSDFTDDNIRAYMKLRKSKVSEATVEMELKSLLSVWRWSADEGWTTKPRFKVAKAVPHVPKAWNRKEMKAIFRAAALYEGSLLKQGSYALPANVFYSALLRLMFDSGERAGAVRKLRWSEVDLDRRWVTFKAENRKGVGRNSDNLQRISRKTARLLKELKAKLVKPSPDGYVFVGRHASADYRNLSVILKAAGLPCDRFSMFHRIRKTHATWLHVTGGDATASLGHSSDEITRKYYLDPRYTRRDYAADLLSGGILQPLRRLVRRFKVALGLW